MASEKLVYAVVLAWNHVEDTLECLESLLGSDYAPVRFLLVDNASTDNTLAEVRRRFPSVEILHSDENLGVSGGYNLGMQYAMDHGAEYILIANNDIQVDPAMAGCLVQALEAHPEAGMGMPKIYHYYGDRTRLWCTGARWRTFPPMVKMTGYGAPDSPRFAQGEEIEFAPSCVLMLRREAVEKVGFFDTGFYFYQDDWDYSLRYRKAGYSIRFVPEAKMWHKVSVSTQKSEKPAKWWVYFGRSAVRYYRKHASRMAFSLFAGWFLIREAIKGNFKRLLPFLQGVRQEMPQGKGWEI